MKTSSPASRKPAGSSRPWSCPESDDLAMPPEGRGDRISKANIDLIKKWITEGANFGAWKGVE
ncbi:MAG: hypothetical protein HS117_12530 [Verrucomicrobiaceae bacterium]|nr:hypothetical protein [Verrucomicrobiaceae bacterium]